MTTTAARKPSIEVAKELVLEYLELGMGDENATTLATLLLHMPREWREGRAVTQAYPRSMAETTFSAILELLAEKRLRLVPHFVSDGAAVAPMRDGTSQPEEHGHWEFGIAPALPT